MFQFNTKYFYVNIFLLSLFLIIIAFINDGIIKLFSGDILIVFEVYFLFKTFIKKSNYELAHYALLVVFSIEVSQFYQVFGKLNLQVDNKIIQIVMESKFDWFDLFAYGLGWGIIVFIESYRLRLDKMSYRVD